MTYQGKERRMTRPAQRPYMTRDQETAVAIIILPAVLFGLSLAGYALYLAVMYLIGS